MTSLRLPLSLAVASLLLLAACATRPVNPPLAQYDPQRSHPFQLAGTEPLDRENLIILAFSGGGTRAAAFSYGVLETLRDVEVLSPKGRSIRLLDEVDVITGVSGGSFTALAYGLYGDKLFDDYEQRFLKRDVQGELLRRMLNPLNWGALWSAGWGRSEMAAQYYDEILFNGATYADLKRPGAPMIVVGATDIASGSRFIFSPNNFDVLCADLDAVRLSRAAAASSAVPVVLSPVTINNYGGSCGYRAPEWARLFMDADDALRPAARVRQRLKEMQGFADGVDNPYLHLVDGGVSDNLGLRAALDVIEALEALHAAGKSTPLDYLRRIVVIVVNSLSTPDTEWNRTEDSPGAVAILLKAAGVPIDRNSGEAVDKLKDIEARWRYFRQVRDSVAFVKDNSDQAVAYLMNAPNASIYAIDLSFPALKDQAERDYLKQLPTSFALSDEAVDRLRAAAKTLILESPEFRRLLKDAGAQMVQQPPAGTPAAPAAKPPRQRSQTAG